MIELLTAAEAAASLGISERTVRLQLAAGTLRGRKVGRDWVVGSDAVETYRAGHLGRPGRPRIHPVKTRKPAPKP